MLQEDSEGSTDNDSDDDPPVPDAEEILGLSIERAQAGSLTIRGQHEETFRGQYHCQLCPDKILLTEKQLEVLLRFFSHRRSVIHPARSTCRVVHTGERSVISNGPRRVQEPPRSGRCIHMTMVSC